MFFRYITILLITLIPAFAFAADAPKNFGELLQIFADILGLGISLLYAIGVLVFFYGIALFVWNTDNDAEREKGKQWMLWGVIAFFVGMTLWGIVRILTGTFELGGTKAVLIPQLPERPTN